MQPIIDLARATQANFVLIGQLLQGWKKSGVDFANNLKYDKTDFGPIKNLIGELRESKEVDNEFCMAVVDLYETAVKVDSLKTSAAGYSLLSYLEMAKSLKETWDVKRDKLELLQRRRLDKMQEELDVTRDKVELLQRRNVDEMKNSTPTMTCGYCFKTGVNPEASRCPFCQGELVAQSLRGRHSTYKSIGMVWTLICCLMILVGLPSCMNMAHEESVSIAFKTGMVGWFFILPGIILWAAY